jgi:23S rRNA (uracil1939-C5)-methyltransferase
MRDKGETVDILRLGHAGDGVTADGLFVPYTVPGDVARVERVEREGARGRVVEILRPGPSRVAAPCRHFTRCGGCALQMMARAPYLAWKEELVARALAQRGFADVPIAPMRAVGAGTRRRAMWKARNARGRVELGFYAPQSRDLVDLDECPVLAPGLAGLMAPLKEGLARVLKPGETAALHATLSDTGVDLSLAFKAQRSSDLLMALSDLASGLGLARLSWNGELVAMAVEPTLRVGRFHVVLPLESFLQPTREGERLLQELVGRETGPARRVADLFSGCGSFALTLADGHAVHAVDNAAPAIHALAVAARAGRALSVTAETRDLFRRPLLPDELARFDAVVLDPPRPGAPDQAKMLARSAVPRILYVSCSPASFARDARILCDGGYRLDMVVPLDQFLWSPHVELFARFERA